MSDIDKRRTLFDLLTEGDNKSSRFWKEDSERLWASILKRDIEVVEGQLERWRAIAATTERECALHCQL